MGEPLHHWPREGDGGVSQRKMWGAGDRGLMTSSKLLWPRSSQEAGTHTALAWFPMAMHTPGGPAHSRVDFGFCLGHEAYIRPAWPSVPGSQRSPGASWGVDVQPRVAPSSSGLLQLLGPSQQDYPCPRRRPGGRRELSTTKSWDLCVLCSLAVKRCRPPGNWA